MKKNPGRKERRRLERANRRSMGRMKHAINICKLPHKKVSLLHKLIQAMGLK